MCECDYDFDEKASENGKQVWQSSKYKESKRKAIEMISAEKYHLSEADFWILKNETKNGGIMYSGLIISHNGCLKINDAMDVKFDASCVTVDKDGWGGSLVYTYCCPAQGIYEVGEASAKNCKNAYPYAMAYKRMFDRVVLKLSKLAYAGIYSEAESEEFKEPLDAPKREPKKAPQQAKAKEPVPVPQAPQQPQNRPISTVCELCGREIGEMVNGKGVTYPPEKVAQASLNNYGKILCGACRAAIDKDKKKK